MTEDRESLSRGDFAHAVRKDVDSALSTYDHHPHGDYTPAAFRHYIRRIALLDALAGLEFRSALDVGCAEGYFMALVRERFGVDVWGVDLSPVALAKAHYKHGLTVAAADATRLPFADGSFDLVYSTEVIEHVLDPDLMVAEMRRLARRTVLVTTPVSQTEDEHEPDFELRAEGHVNNFDPATVRRLFGPQATLGSFRCNATLAMIVGAGRYLPAGARDVFYRLDHRVSQRWGAPTHRVKPLRNRDWLITVPGLGGAAGAATAPAAAADDPQWRCPACHGPLQGDAQQQAGQPSEHEQSLRCASCGAVYAVAGGVPDFFEAVTPPSAL
ncbi:MAG TPA: class I SAM-dependent methyltransferase [Solirubrobacteraceae bacterium]|nr:class I SAM-dependent methyltransferase [Solirubrobacteraceae bacterium]